MYFASKTLKVMERHSQNKEKNDPQGAERRERQERKRSHFSEYLPKNAGALQNKSVNELNPEKTISKCRGG